MNPAVEHYAQRVMSGAEPGTRAALLRAGLAVAEPFYAGVARLRNRLYDAGVLRTHRLPVPVVSVGNLTTGGTGKTPVVRWLAESLRKEGRHVAIVSRGYRAPAPGQLGDEQFMLARQLNAPGHSGPDVHIRAHPDRVAAATAALKVDPAIDVVLLDDGLQHRRLARDFDLVLVSAANPFGFGHLLPRGLLREPQSGLRRAGAILLTHADQAGEDDIASIERTIRRYTADVPICHAVHAHAGFRTETDDGGETRHDPDDLRGRRWFAFCGIGSPQTFLAPLGRAGGEAVGRRVFGDHHHYTRDDWTGLLRDARSAGADMLVTTEKDWVKVAPLHSATAIDQRLPVWRADVAIRFRAGDDSALLARVRTALSDGG